MGLSFKMVFNEKIVYLILLIFLQYNESTKDGQPCITPNGEQAVCKSQFSCDSILKAFSSRDPTALKFAEESFCGVSGKLPLVCCGKDYTFSTPVEEVTTEKLDKKKLLPSKAICGHQQTDDRFESRPNTQIDEYPWQGLLYFSGLGSSVPRFFCSGAVISDRYVLTTAACADRRFLSLEYVRLGEYDISKNGSDCVENPDVSECTEPFINFNVEKVIIHPGYRSDGRYPYADDLGLIRLAKRINWSDYIRPICLPDDTPKIQDVGTGVYTSGWGGDAYNDGKVSIKKNDMSVVISVDECQSGTLVNLTNKICVQSKIKGASTSGGDEGAPMMSFVPGDLQWYLIGIVQIIGYDKITIGMKISSYVDWVVSNLEP